MTKPNATPSSDGAPLSLNLSVDDAKKHLNFLRGLHTLGMTTRPITDEMLGRYINQWLPLLADHQKGATDTKMSSPIMMIPPPDVAWLWHCHRLAPKHYEAYTMLHFGFVVEPCPSFLYQLDEDAAKQSEHEESNTPKDEAGMEMMAFNIAEAAAFTKNQWSQIFRNDPFFLTPAEESQFLNDPNVNKVRFNEELAFNWSKKLGGYNLIASAACQANFLWQVSGPRFLDDDFLREGIKEYHKFLLLKDNGKLLPLVPTYQIDLMWHTHILVNCKRYMEDCTRIRGGPFHHDDSLNDRTPGAKLDKAFIATSSLWKKTYGTEYYAAGGMYRGEPPTAFYDAANWTLAAGIDAGDRMVIIRLASASFPPSTNHRGILVGGSSSAGWNVVEDADTLPWPNPSSGNLFIAAASKSTTQYVNNNPKRDGYVFGKGSLGIGYYSPQTLDAWKILRIRLVGKSQNAAVAVNCFDCKNCLCFGFPPSSSQVQKKDRLIKEWVELEWKLAFVTAKSNCAGPSVDPDPTEVNKHLLARHKNKLDKRLYGIESAQSRTSPASFFSCVWVAGCGGGSGGGGCGAGGCGAGGCGAGGCGGCGGGCGG